MLLGSIFRRWGVRHATAVNGMDALEMIRSERFDLLLMDIRMPGIDGIKTTEHIRNVLQIDDSAMPVICVTAAFLDDDLQKYREAGMNAFLRKPFSERSLLDGILAVTGGNRVTPAEAEAPEDTTAPAATKEPAGVTASVATTEPAGETATKGITASESTAEPAAGHAGTGTGQVDLSSLYRLSGGDERFVKEMLVTFIESNNKGLEEMLENIKTDDLEKIADLSHKLIPPCRHLGATDLTALLTEIEKRGRTGGDIVVIERLIGEFQRAFLEIRREIEANISKIR